MALPVSIKTARLLLRTVTPEDAAAVAASWKLDEGPISPEEAGEVIARMMRSHAQNRPRRLAHLCLAIIHAETQEWIGWCGLDHTNPQLPHPALFYLLKQRSWGKGLATEAAAAVIDYAFRALDLDRIDSAAAYDNLASKRVMEKIGMRYIGLDEEGGHSFILSKDEYWRGDKMIGGMFQDTMVNMNWTDIQEHADKSALVLLPLGVIEEHGPHLPLGTDIYTAHIHSIFIKRRLEEKGFTVVIAPPFYWGVCQATGGFIGSFRVRKETAKALLLDILASLAGFGFKDIFGINAHGDIEQNVVIVEAFKEATETLGIRACYPFPQPVMHHYGLDGSEPHICPVPPQAIRVGAPAAPDVHAGDSETATINHFYPALADVQKAKTLPPVALGDDRIMTWLFGGHTQELSPGGYLGAPADFESVEVIQNISDIADRVSAAILARLATA